MRTRIVTRTPTVAALVALAILVASAPALPQTSGRPYTPRTYAVADLPTCDATVKGWVYEVYDAADADDCSVGGGALAHSCQCDGSSWVAIALGGGVPDGTGAANQCAFWSDTDTLTSEASCKIESGAGSDTLVVDSASRVGIGTAAPAALLHLNAATPALRLQGSAATWDETVKAGGAFSLSKSGSGAEEFLVSTQGTSTTLQVAGGGVFTTAFQVTSLTNCDTTDTNGSGVFSCGTDDDVPESGDFGAAGDLDADGTLSANSVDASEVNFNYAGSSSEGGAATTALALDADGANCSFPAVALGVSAAGACQGTTTGKAVSDNAILTSHGTVGLQGTGCSITDGDDLTCDRLAYTDNHNIVGGVDTCQTSTSGTQQLGECSSSLRLKTGLRSITEATERLDLLRPVRFDWISGKPDAGLLAEDVARALPVAVNRDPDGEVSSYNVRPVLALVVAALQEARVREREQRRTIAALELAMRVLSARLDAVLSALETDLGPGSDPGAGSLAQLAAGEEIAEGLELLGELEPVGNSECLEAGEGENENCVLHRVSPFLGSSIAHLGSSIAHADR